MTDAKFLVTVLWGALLGGLFVRGAMSSDGDPARALMFVTPLLFILGAGLRAANLIIDGDSR